MTEFFKEFQEFRKILCICPCCNDIVRVSDLHLKTKGKVSKTWLDKYAPESVKFTVQEKLPENARKLNCKQKEFLKKITQEINKNWKAEEFQKMLYEWRKEFGISSKDAFSAIYTVLLDKDHGPKAGWLILSLDKDFIKQRFLSISS